MVEGKKTHWQTAKVKVERQAPELAMLASSELKSHFLLPCSVSICSDTATTKPTSSCVSRFFAEQCLQRQTLVQGSGEKPD